MKIQITRDEIIITYVDKDIEKRNKEFVEAELPMLKKLNPNRSEKEKIIDLFETIGSTANSSKEQRFHRKHRLITLNDAELGDLMSIECESGNYIEIDLILFDYIWGKQLGQGDLYIQTQMNKELLDMRKK